MSEIHPYIAADDARAALAWYVDAMGATVTVDPIVMPDGHVGHAELSFDGARVMLSDSYRDIGVAANQDDTTAVTLYLTVADVDDLARSVAEHGGTLDRGPEDSGHGRTAVFHDPFGHRWMLGELGS